MFLLILRNLLEFEGFFVIHIENSSKGLDECMMEYVNGWISVKTEGIESGYGTKYVVELERSMIGMMEEERQMDKLRTFLQSTYRSSRCYLFC